MSDQNRPPSNNRKPNDDLLALQIIAENAHDINWLINNADNNNGVFRRTIAKGDPTYTKAVQTLLLVLETTFTDPRFKDLENRIVDAMTQALDIGKEELLTNISIMIAERNLFHCLANKANAAVKYAQELSENNPERNAEVLSLLLEVSLLRNNQDFDDAAYANAIYFCRENGNRKLESKLQQNIAYALLHRGDPEQAHNHAIRAYQLSTELQDLPNLFRCTLALACIARFESRWEEAQKFLNEGWQLFDALSQKQDVSNPKMANRRYALTYETASLHWNAQRYPEAIADFKQALEASIQAKMPYEVARCHDSLALAYDKVEQFDAAFKHISKAERRWRKLENLYQIAYSLYIRGYMLAHQSQFEPNLKPQALSALDEALAQAKLVVEMAARQHLINEINDTINKLIASAE